MRDHEIQLSGYIMYVLDNAPSAMCAFSVKTHLYVYANETAVRDSCDARQLMAVTNEPGMSDCM